MVVCPTHGRTHPPSVTCWQCDIGPSLLKMSEDLTYRHAVAIDARAGAAVRKFWDVISGGLREESYLNRTVEPRRENRAQLALEALAPFMHTCNHSPTPDCISCLVESDRISRESK